jgi:outer membrane protein OmpA-like peptidoglycan-associated protein
MKTAIILAIALAGCHHDRPAPRTLPPPPDFRVETSTATERALPASIGQRPIAPEELVFFEFDSTQLSPMDRESLGHVARWARSHPSRVITVVGHADHIGSHAYNLALSVERARAVELYLESLGVPAEQIVLVGRGETKALPKAGPVDRRVLIVAEQT